MTLDDATSEVYSGFFVAEEGTMSSFRLSEVIAERGLFCSLYADRAAHYWHTPKAGGKVDNPTQVGRALQQLGIELIAAYSPEARGRSERMFGTLQKRLPQELRLAGITTRQDANRFLEEVFWPEHLTDILSLQEERRGRPVKARVRVHEYPAVFHGCTPARERASLVPPASPAGRRAARGVRGTRRPPVGSRRVPRSAFPSRR